MQEASSRIVPGAERPTQPRDATAPPQGTRPAAAQRRPYASLWKVWVPIPILFILLDVAFNLYFWKIPRLSGDADYGYQFLIDVHRLSLPKPEGAIRVLAFGSSVSMSFDAYQIGSLIDASDPAAAVEVHRLLKPGIKPADYRLFFEAAGERVRPDIALVLFNLLDFLNPSFERGFRPAVREALPPWSILREHYQSIPTMAEKLDLSLASASNLYRYRKLIRSAVRDHLVAAMRWARSRPVKGGYGWYPDGYTKQRFGLPVSPASRVALEYYVDPEWIRQRGKVALSFSVDGQTLAGSIETEPGWKAVSLHIPATSENILNVTADSTWTPRAGGNTDDARLLGVRFREPPPKNLLDGNRAPYRYPPFDEGQIHDFLRMGSETGTKFAERWNEVLNSKTDFGARFRAYRDSKLAIREQAFQPTGEYAEMERLVNYLSRRGTFVVLVNTPESPWILDDYQESPYYRAYLAFFQGLANKYSNVRFSDLRSSLPPEDFNDWHHVNYVGEIKLGPIYKDLVAAAIADLELQRSN